MIEYAIIYPTTIGNHIPSRQAIMPQHECIYVIINPITSKHGRQSSPITHAHSISQSSPRASSIDLSLDQFGSLEIKTDYSKTRHRVTLIYERRQSIAMNRYRQIENFIYTNPVNRS